MVCKINNSGIMFNKKKCDLALYSSTLSLYSSLHASVDRYKDVSGTYFPEVLFEISSCSSSRSCSAWRRPLSDAARSCRERSKVKDL